MAQSTIIGAGAGTGTSIAIPAHQVGDLILIAAYRDGATAVPTKPAAAGTVPAWTDVDAAAGANLNSMRTARFVATGTNHTSGTWTNATGMAVIVLRGDGGIGAHSVSGTAVGNGGSLTTTALTGEVTDGTSQFVSFFGWRTVTTWGSAPAGFTRQAQVGTEIEIVTRDTTTSEAALTVSGIASGNGGYRTNTIEVLGGASAPLDLDLGKVPTAEAVRGIDLAAAGPVSLGLGKVPTGAAAQGIDLAAAGPDVLALGRVSTGATVRGINLAQAGPVSLGLGRAPSGADVRGLALAQSGPVSLGLGRVLSTDVTARDDFNRSDAVTLGADWKAITAFGAGSCYIAGDQAQGNGSTSGNYRNDGPYADDQFSEAVIPALPDNGSWVGVTVRQYDGVSGGIGGAGYLLIAFSNPGSANDWRIYRMDAGSYTQIGGPYTVSTSPGDRMRLDVAGTTLTAYHNGVSIGSTTDATHAGGAPGIQMFKAHSTDQLLEDWRGGALGGPRGITLAQSGPVSLGLGKVPTGGAVRGITLGGAALELALGHVAGGATVRGVDLALSGPLALSLGRVPSGATARGIALGLSGPVVLSLGRVPSGATVRGVDLAGAALTLALGKVSTTGIVRGIVLVSTPVAATGTVVISDSALATVTLTEAAGSVTTADSTLARVDLTEAAGDVTLADEPTASVVLTETPT